MQKDKVESILGFAIKAGKVIFGADSIERYHKKKHLIIMCKTLATNTREKLLRTNPGVPAIVSHGIEVEELTHKLNCKVIAVTDKQMAQAILTNKNGTYQVVTEVK